MPWQNSNTSENTLCFTPLSEASFFLFHMQSTNVGSAKLYQSQISINGFMLFSYSVFSVCEFLQLHDISWQQVTRLWPCNVRISQALKELDILEGDAKKQVGLELCPGNYSVGTAFKLPESDCFASYWENIYILCIISDLSPHTQHWATSFPTPEQSAPKVKVKVAQSFATPQTIQSTEFSRPEYWSG